MITITTAAKTTVNEQIILSNTNSMISMNNKMAASIEDLSINNDTSTICANCGKDVSNPNICNKCKAATYCNASCKKKHRSKHKQECEKRVAELHEEQLERDRRAAELHDEKLFIQPPPNEDCPICMLRLPSLEEGRVYRPCCGKMICSGCLLAAAMRNIKEQKCAFCRTPAPTSAVDMLDEMKKRAGVGDAEAICNLGSWYADGDYGMPQNHNKALELWHQAAKLGYAPSHFNIGNAYYAGDGVERNEKKAVHYYELAATGGDVESRYNLGAMEFNAGNMDRALKHFVIAAGCGSTVSLEDIKQMFMDGQATKDDYAKALRVHQANLVEIKSSQRDEAAAFDERYKYYEE